MSEINDSPNGKLMAELKPIYKHDCDDCYFLGNMSYGTEDALDLYVCPNGALGTTLISRYSNEPGMTASFPRSIVESMNPSQLWPGSMMGIPVALLLVQQMELLDKMCPTCKTHEDVAECRKYWWHCNNCNNDFGKDAQ